MSDILTVTLLNETVSAEAYSDALKIKWSSLLNLECDWGAGLTATLELQFTNAHEPEEADWKTAALVLTSPAGTANGFNSTVALVGAPWVRVKVGSVAGSGTLVIRTFNKVES